MGKRKERRLAAKNAAGRRVKLDLFAEPFGDLGGSSVHEEVGGDLDSKHHAGLPNSPSSSDFDGKFFSLDQQPGNPLLLLGQYSDDELEEESNEKPNDGIVDSSPDNNDQVNEPVDQDTENMEVNVDGDLVVQIAKQEESESALVDFSPNLESNDIRHTDTTASGDLCEAVDSTTQTSVHAPSDTQVIGDVSFGWKLVMHEASNQYYYWNIDTGETSWEVPAVLVHGTETSAVTEASAPIVAHQSTSSLKGDLGGSSDMHDRNTTDEPQMDAWNETTGKLLGDKNLVPGGDFSHESSLGNYISSQQSCDVFLVNEGSTIAVSESMHHTIASNDVDLASRLIQYSEYLLGRLKSLKGFKDHLQGQDWTSKYILEVEIRLSDVRSLLSYGSSLLPFWMHSESQLKRLEESINLEVHLHAQKDEVEATTHVSSFVDQNKSGEIVGNEAEADQNEKLEAHSSKDSGSEALNCDVNTEHVSSFGYDIKCPGSVAEHNSEELNGTVFHDELTTLKPEVQAGEDVDMDVEMEVEVEDTSGAGYSAPLQLPVEPNPPAEYPSLASEDRVSVPPPPDEEWIPPPPPDNEPFPPPPPDEPPEPSYPPPASYSETIVQPLPYTEHYSLPYSSSTFEYYGPTSMTEVPNSNYYVQSEVCPVSIPHPPLYYEAVSYTYSSNPAEPVAHCDLQEGKVPVVGGFFHQNGSASTPTEAVCSSLPDTKVDFSAVGETEVAAADSLTAAAAAAAAAAASSVAKAPSKVLRSKKRANAVAPTLRSNKKVSSLVDKWKAAKEELHDDEDDEPEDPYEALEKKKQKEIEQWRAQQIASGEARDNANFQPLGGDWRERVKRKRRQLKSETVESLPEALVDKIQKPDVVQLQKDLPSGWQVYWDENSKQVYYGNVITSETTWTRPTK